MQTPRVCPECDSLETERVHTDFRQYTVLEVRICNNCPTEYDVTYADPVKETTHTEHNNESE